MILGSDSLFSQVYHHLRLLWSLVRPIQVFKFGYLECKSLKVS